MYAKIDGSGCDIRKGFVQIRISMYLEPGDARYDEHHIEVIDEQSKKYEKDYPGEVNEHGEPVDRVAYSLWLDSLPKVWQLNPFHNHFIYIEPDADTVSVLNEIKGHITNFYVAWANEQPIIKGWLNRTKLIATDLSPARIAMCEARLSDIKDNYTAILIRL